VRVGVSCTFIGKVGDDAFGHRLAATLTDAGVDAAGLRYDAQARTTTNFIALPTPNTSEFLFFRNPGADMLLRPDELDYRLFEGARAFYFGALGISGEPLRAATLSAARHARAAGCMILFDANYRASLWQSEAHAVEALRAVLPFVDVLKVNEAELALLTGNDQGFDAARLLTLGPSLVVTTLGPAGCRAVTAHQDLAVAGFPVAAVDASGCGDAFVGGLISQLLLAADWRQTLAAAALRNALQFANATAALTALQRGVIPALPRAADVLAFLDSSISTHTWNR
jgi:fructokinase